MSTLSGGWRGPNIVKDSSLILYYDANSVHAYPDGLGTTWKELSGKGNNGTLINGPTYNINNGGSIYFDGTNDYIECGVNPLVNSATAFTIDMYFYTPNIGAEKMLFSTSLPSSGWHIEIYNSRIYFQYYPSGGGFASNTAFNNNTWYNYVLTYDGSTVKSYYNGILENSYSSTITSQPTGNTNIANFTYYGPGVAAYSFEGRIPITRFYNRALTSTEVTQNFNATRGRFGL